MRRFVIPAQAGISGGQSTSSPHETTPVARDPRFRGGDSLVELS
jgi:hypothetical protein